MADAGQQRSRAAGLVAALSAGGAGLGLMLAAAAAGHPASTACASAARQIGACVPGQLAGVKPYVTAALIGLLLGALVGIAAVLVWREAVAAFGPVGRRAPVPPRHSPRSPAAGYRGRIGHLR